MAISTEEMLARLDYRDEHGPFDIVGDVHGCYDELIELLETMSYQRDDVSGMRHPQGRCVVFVGDLVDRGPKVVEVVTLARQMAEAGLSLCVPGNHDAKLLRYLLGHPVQVKHGLAESIAQIEALPEPERDAWIAGYEQFIAGLPTHLLLDGGALVVAHGGIRAEDQGRDTPRIRAFTLYGLPTGERDAQGLPIRLDWAADYTGEATVVYGHTPMAEAVWQNNTLCIDTGCVFGGSLTALRWPEREVVSVPARQVYAVRGR